MFARRGVNARPDRTWPIMRTIPGASVTLRRPPAVVGRVKTVSVTTSNPPAELAKTHWTRAAPSAASHAAVTATSQLDPIWVTVAPVSSGRQRDDQGRAPRDGASVITVPVIKPNMTATAKNPEREVAHSTSACS